MGEHVQTFDWYCMFLRVRAPHLHDKSLDLTHNCPLVQSVSENEDDEDTDGKTSDMWADLDAWVSVPGSKFKRCDSPSTESGKCHVTLTYWLQGQ